jgi:phage terminase small subunit
MATNRPARPSNKSRRGGGFAERLAQFEQIYMANGNNATAAAIETGYSPKTAHAMGHKLITRLRETGRLAKVAEKAAARAELSTARTLQEVRDIAYNDPRRFFRDNGTLKPPKEWDDGMAACVQSLEVTELAKGTGKKRKVIGHTGKIKFWSKIDALDKAMRHAGLFEKDNRQKQENLAIQINLVGGPEPRAVNGSGVTVQANLIGPNGKNGSHP